MSLIYLCDECPHVFSFEDVQEEVLNGGWGHPCFMGTSMRLCESYRACYRRVTSPITDDSFNEEAAMSDDSLEQPSPLRTVPSFASADAAAEVWEKVEQRLQKLIDAYPPDVFIEPPAGQHGETIDACSASMARHVGGVLLRWCRAQKEEAKNVVD